MKWRRALTATPLFIVLSTTGALTEPSTDIEGVKTASKAFYDVVVVVDVGAAMQKVWAHKPYVTYVGPKSTGIIVGWDVLGDILRSTESSAQFARADT